MYRKIRKHATTLQRYSERLIKEGVLSQEDVDRMKADWRKHLDGEFDAGQAFKPNKADWLDGKWAGMRRADDEEDPRRGETGIPMGELKENRPGP